MLAFVVTLNCGRRYTINAQELRFSCDGCLSYSRLRQLLPRIRNRRSKLLGCSAVTRCRRLSHASF